MKKILALVAAATTLGFAVPSETQAWDRCSTPHSRIISYLPCGRPVYATYQVYGYDRCGNALGRWVTQHSHCGCMTCNPRPACPPPSYGHFGGYHRSHSAPAASCAPRGGVSWIFSFGR